MRYINILIVVLICSLSYSYAQKMNKQGHIISVPTYFISSDQYTTKNHSEILYKNKNFAGTSLFKIPIGYLSLSGEYEMAGSTVRIYNEQGEMLFNKSYTQTINIQFSESAEYCAFYTGKNITVLNTRNFSEAYYNGTTHFAVNNAGELAYIQKENNSLHYKSSSHTLAEPATHIIIHGDEAIVATRTKLYKTQGLELIKIYESPIGSIFDLESIQDTIYFSRKTRNTNGFVFSLYKIQTDEAAEILDQQEYPIHSKSIPLNKTSLPNHLQKGSKELIRNPMDYYADSSFQSVGNTYNEIQEYSPGSTYLHPGVDLFGDHLDSVYSVKWGIVKAILTTSGDYHWRVAVSNNNTADSSIGYLYAHLDQNLIPYSIGDTIQEAEVVGQLVDFPVQGFVHCHFARIISAGNEWFGDWWTLDDPLHYMINFMDTTAPVFIDALPGRKVAIKRLDNGEYLSQNFFGTNVDIITKSYDYINNTLWKVDVYEIGYEIYKTDQPNFILEKKTSFNFDYFNDTYFSGPYIQDVISTMYMRDDSCFSTGNYDERAFYHVLSNSNADDTITVEDEQLYIDPDKYSGRGDYVLKFWAKDAYGNTRIDSIIFTLTLLGLESNKIRDMQIYPNPTYSRLYISNLGIERKMELYSIEGKMLLKFNMQTGSQQIDLSPFEEGMYILRCENTFEKILLKKH